MWSSSVGWVDDSVLGSLWVRIGRWDIKCYTVMVGICYRPLGRGEEVDKAFCKQLEEVNELLLLVHVGELNPLMCVGSAM